MLDFATPTFRERSFDTLKTERLTLRRPTLADVEAIVSLANDRRVAENTRRLPYPYSVTHAVNFVRATVDNREIVFLIEHHDTPIGMVGIDRSASGETEFGCWLGVAYWGRGFATEAAQAAIDFFFEEFSGGILCAGARVINPASRNVLEKCGFQWSGVELHRFEALGSSTPVDRFRISRGIWSSLKKWSGATRRTQ